MAEGKGVTGSPVMPEKSERKIKELKDEISRTRSDLSGTVEAIAQKISPRHIRTEVSGKMRDATIGRIKNMAENTEMRVKEAGASILDTIKSNPVPTAFLGIGIFLLIRNRAKSRAGEAAHRAKEKAGQLKSEVKQKAEELGYRGRERAEGAFYRARQMVERNIWGAGLLAMASGMLLGLGIPESERERQVMGGASRKALSKVREKAEEKMEKVSSAGEETARKTHEEEVVI